MVIKTEKLIYVSRSLCVFVCVFVKKIERQRTLLSMNGNRGIVKLAKDEFHTVE